MGNKGRQRTEILKRRAMTLEVSVRVAVVTFNTFVKKGLFVPYGEDGKVLV